jgi:hypothetical protein
VQLSLVSISTILTEKRIHKSIKNVRSFRGADANSDHILPTNSKAETTTDE